jgi:hypothetical protein
VEVVRRIGCVAEVVADDTGCCRMAEVVEGYGCVVDMVGVGWCWVDAAFSPASALAPATTGKGCQCYTITLPDSPDLY